MARKLSISFKETKKDIELYEFLNELDDKSADIKRALRSFYKNEFKQSETPVKENVDKIDSDIDVLNF